MLNTVFVQLIVRGLKACQDGMAIAVQKISASELMMHLGELVDEGPADAVELAAAISNKTLEKYDSFLSDELRCINYTVSHLGPQNAWDAILHIMDLEQI